MGIEYLADEWLWDEFVEFLKYCLESVAQSNEKHILKRSIYILIVTEDFDSMLFSLKFHLQGILMQRSFNFVQLHRNISKIAQNSKSATVSQTVFYTNFNF